MSDEWSDWEEVPGFPEWKFRSRDVKPVSKPMPPKMREMLIRGAKPDLIIMDELEDWDGAAAGDQPGSRGQDAVLGAAASRSSSSSRPGRSEKLDLRCPGCGDVFCLTCRDEGPAR